MTENYKKRKNMSEAELVAHFKELFPNFAAKMSGYRRTGSNMLAIQFKGKKSLVFLYNNEENWTFGTKLYRMVPETYMKHLEAVRNGEVVNKAREEEESK